MERALYRNLKSCLSSYYNLNLERSVFAGVLRRVLKENEIFGEKRQNHLKIFLFFPVDISLMAYVAVLKSNGCYTVCLA